MIDTLIIIGNGFDRWQGLDTSYSHFQKYYLDHRDEIQKALHIRKHLFSDVELIYGNPFRPEELSDDFWYTFEASLDKIDSESINAFFGKDNKQLYKMQTSIENAQEILRKAFCDWIGTIHIDGKDSGYLFGDNCFCINFNYTDTLQKRFHAVHECHIHGEKDEPESIIFGHSAHPQRATQELAQFGGRFLGLYLIEEALYETDKHVYENIQFLRVDMASDGVKLDQIKDIYVLGHSFGPADYGYFEYIMKETSVKGTHNRKNIRPELVDTMDELHLRIQYAIHRYGEGKPVTREEQEAVDRRLLFEQAFDEEDILGDFYSILPELKRKGQCVEDARWHISYFSVEDKRRIESVMRQLGCTNYELFSSIDQCIERFRK